MSETPPPGPADAPAPTSLPALIIVLGACGFASTFTMRIIDPLIPTLAGEFARSVPQRRECIHLRVAPHSPPHLTCHTPPTCAATSVLPSTGRALLL